MPLSYATGRLASANPASSSDARERRSSRVLGAIDLFWIWWCVSLPIGSGVLFKRKTTGSPGVPGHYV
jgi:hypothetical protein